MLSIKPISFSGNVIRQTHDVYDKNSPNHRKTVETTKDEFLHSYDEQICEIRAHKRYAQLLDKLMFEDPDITKAISELPDDFEIEVAANFSANSLEDGELVFDDPMLLADEEMIADTDKGKKLSREELSKACDLNCEYDFTGPKKEMILGWLENLKTFFK